MSFCLVYKDNTLIRQRIQWICLKTWQKVDTARICGCKTRYVPLSVMDHAEDVLSRVETSGTTQNGNSLFIYINNDIIIKQSNNGILYYIVQNNHN